MVMRESSSGPIKIETIDVTTDWPSIVAVTAPDVAIVVPNARVGDSIIITPLGVWPAGITLPQGRCLVAGTVQARAANVTAGAIDPASQALRICLIHDSPTGEP